MKPQIPIIFCLMMVIIGTAEAQPYQETHLSVNGVEQVIGTGQVQILKIPSGIVFSTIHIEEPETISCTLENCVANVQVDNTFGGYIAKISGTMTNQTSQIQLVSQGQTTYTIVMETEQKQVVTQDPSMIGIPQIMGFPYEVYGILGAIVVIGIGVLLWNKSKGVGQIETI